MSNYKSILILILCFLPLFMNLSCEDPFTEKESTIGAYTVVVLSKDQFTYRTGVTYRLYIYDGKEAYWITSDASTFKNYNKGDTVSNIAVFKHYYERKK